MIVGLTGGIGSGKSSAANFFIELGIDVIDADQVSKNILDSNKEAKNKFIDSFGKEFLDANNNIDRSLLRSKIFKDEHKKSLLESIIHPLVREEILKFIEKSKSIYKIIMVPLIFETKSESFYDKIVVVDCEEKIQISRASKRDKKSRDNIINIMKTQASREERNSISDMVIMNNDSLEDLRKEVITTHQKLLGININE
jgi:dephospho-CoA kinase